jgi:flagellar L-ring protein precursor FlgH
MNLRLLLLLLTSIILTGCSSTIEKLQRVGKDPSLAQMDMPVDETQPSPAEKEVQNRSYMKRTNSLWQPGSTSFFRDNRAWRIGDILKVVVNISDSANLSNSTTQTRSGGDGLHVTKLFGKERAISKLAGYTASAQIAAANPLNLLEVASSHNPKGSGAIARQEQVTANVAAVVRQVMPNGNLIIEGHQEIRVNSELREVKVAGIIRPRDITSNNSIDSSQIAEARISYGGRGVVSDMQTPRIGTQVLDIITPF